MDFTPDVFARYLEYDLHLSVEYRITQYVQDWGSQRSVFHFLSSSYFFMGRLLDYPMIILYDNLLFKLLLCNQWNHVNIVDEGDRV